MRKYAILVVSIIFSILMLNNCKKGENDPFFSIYSRKARVVADWDINAKSSVITEVLNDGQSAKIDFQITGKTNVKELMDSINTPKDTTKERNGEVLEGYYHFNKDGSMEYVLHYNLVDDSTETDENTEETASRIITTIYKERHTGTWNFLGRVDDYKNKERISMVWEDKYYSKNTIYKREVTDAEGIQLSVVNASDFESHEEKYANGENAEVWEITQLKNKEIIMQRYVDRADIYTWTDSLGYKSTFKGFETLTLQQKTKN